MSADLALSNTSCRILVVSPSLSQATALISRIQTLGNTSSTIPETTSDGGGNQERDLLSPDLVKIPWTINNKYYSADVHFAAHPMRALAPYLLQNVPAVIFAWGDGEAYKHHIERLSQDVGEHEPDVLLAVRVSLDGEPNEPGGEEEKEEDNSMIDGFLSSLGFEYVDAKEGDAGQMNKTKYEDGGDDGIPSLPRVLDALSTIMWPSMRAREGGAEQEKGRVQRDPSLFEWGTGGSQDNISALVGSLADPGSQLSARARRLQGEMDELTRWLEDEEREDPWRMAASSDVIASSPVGDAEFLIPPSSTSGRDAQDTPNPPPTTLAKFDDDFTVFVSAPAVGAEGSGRSTPVEGGFEDQERLKPSGGLRSYNSLGSISDFGGSEGDKDAGIIDDDESLPTEKEILETTSKIFGKEFKTSSSQATRDAEPLEERDKEFDLAPFDLSRVFGVLQEMKEEIAGMEDEGERRKAAARVALGLVYGLEAEGDGNSV